MKRATLLAIVLLTSCNNVTDADSRAGSEFRLANVGATCSAASPGPSLGAAARDSLAPLLPPGDTNAQWAAIAQRVPGGWGGSFVEKGVLTMYLVDTTQRQAAAEALSNLSIPSARAVKQGRWDFAQLHDWYRYLNRSVREVPGVTLSDIQEARNRIEYGVVDEATRARVEQRLATLGVPCGLVAIGIIGYAQLL